MAKRSLLSIVIPVWCEADEIAEATASALRIADEVIVADAGSPDGTAAIAAAHGARVVNAPKGRGAQLAAGAQSASGDVLLFLHADVRLPPEARVAIESALRDAAVAGGNFFVRFEPESAAARLFTWANHVRRRWLRVYYGDSAIFVRRSAYLALGGIRDLPILEDYEFVRRLERSHRTAYLHDVVAKVSARRFERAPLMTLFVWTLLQVMYSLGVSAHSLARFYRDVRRRGIAA
ncbi:TIGR04283 family arsenosugar biosynthesis glycosyltransferase [Labilithrix luteola]|nr:TIGR04283 family arsenosugar biosynthesis glycosyltransferase [Labilithrix luteola]